MGKRRDVDGLERGRKGKMEGGSRRGREGRETRGRA